MTTKEFIVRFLVFAVLLGVGSYLFAPAKLPKSSAVILALLVAFITTFLTWLQRGGWKK